MSGIGRRLIAQHANSRPTNQENERFGSELRAEPTPRKTGQPAKQARTQEPGSLTDREEKPWFMSPRISVPLAAARDWSGGAAEAADWQQPCSAVSLCVVLGARRRSSRWEAGCRSYASPGEVTGENSEARAGEVGREGGGAEAGGKITASKVRSPAVGGVVGTRWSEGGKEGEERGGPVRRRKSGNSGVTAWWGRLSLYARVGSPLAQCPGGVLSLV